MALQVWLPLNGNLENKGVADVTVTNNGATVNSNGKIGSCYSFDGTNDYFQFNNLDINNLSGFSICFWCYSVDATLYGLFTVRQNTFHQFTLNNDGLGFRDSKHSSYTTFTFEQPNANIWTHYAIVYDNGSFRIYKNGVNVCTQTYSSGHLNSNLNEIRIGRREASSGNVYFNGKLNDFRIYNHALSLAEVKEISRGLVLHYKLDSIYDSIIIDSSGYGNNGTITGTITSSNDSPRYSSSIFMNNTNTANRIETNKIICSDNIQSISFWVKCAKNSNQVLIANPGLIVVGLLNSKIYLNPASAAGFSTTNFVTNQWNHIVAIRNGTTYSLYINDVAETQNAANNYYTHDGDKLYLLNRNYDNSYAGNASLSDVRIYNTILSQEDILQLYKISGKVDNKKNLHCYELEEHNTSDNTKLFKTGVFRAIEFNEIDNVMKIKEDLDIDSNQLIEM